MEQSRGSTGTVNCYFIARIKPSEIVQIYGADLSDFLVITSM
uniref:Uncharacterized protein n=1 Tax=Arundo donax TaxID=35708 RepID=A0A0A8YDQ9_ARUDO